jgi:DNA-binding response OmpR family regulator
MPNGSGPLARSILIVEDEFLIAFDLRDKVESLGYDVLGPASSCPKALSLLDNTEPAAALLDETLDGCSVEPVADELARRSVPFAVLSGHPRSLSPSAALRSAHRVEKPTSLSDLKDVLEQLTRSADGNNG